MDATYAFWLTTLGVCMSSIGVLILGMEVIAAHRVEFHLLYLHQARMQALALQNDPDGEVRRAHAEMMVNIDRLSENEQSALRAEASALSVPPGHLLYPSTQDWIEKRASALAADISSQVEKRSDRFYSARAESILERRSLFLKIGVVLLILGGIPQLIVGYLNMRGS